MLDSPDSLGYKCCLPPDWLVINLKEADPEKKLFAKQFSFFKPALTDWPVVLPVYAREGKTAREIAKAIGGSHRTVLEHAERLGIHLTPGPARGAWRPWELSLLTQLGGDAITIICERTGRTRRAVLQKKKKMQLFPCAHLLRSFSASDLIRTPATVDAAAGRFEGRDLSGTDTLSAM